MIVLEALMAAPRFVQFAGDSLSGGLDLIDLIRDCGPGEGEEGAGLLRGLDCGLWSHNRIDVPTTHLNVGCITACQAVAGDVNRTICRVGDVPGSLLNKTINACAKCLARRITHRKRIAIQR